jgi:hypothetical protein
VTLIFPTAKPGRIIGTPHQGTHALPGGWADQNAVDIGVPVGTPVRAVADGVIGSQIGSLGKGGRFAGLRLHLLTAADEFYYAHLSRLLVHAGQHVKAGQIIGYSGEANGVPHLHFASRSGDPSVHADKDHPSGLLDVIARSLPGPLQPLGAGLATLNDSGVDTSVITDPAEKAAEKTAGFVVSKLWDAVSTDAMRMLLYVLLVGGGLALALGGVRQLAHHAPQEATA